MQISLYSTTLEAPTKVKLNASVFEAKVSPTLFSQYLRVYLNNQRSSHAKVMDRGEVSGTTKKMWAQKGTGRARHGSAKAPLFVGGGSAHGPTGQQNYHLSFPKAMRQKALSYVLTNLVAQNKLIAIDDLSGLEPKTKAASKLFISLLDILKITKNPPRVLLITKTSLDTLAKATSNLPWLNYSVLGQVNPYLLAKSDLVIVTPDVLEVWNQTHASK